ncbi:Multidrug resistance-associated protein 1 [Cytospora mali]|uniref:Multidrug resistance-associated protein 1 n=1 Tax=Cytospora mali TaxID=578113 RepID=A0A194W065_CYTMA|nr:Multidrug resistance-associated protein 1 [Valsa mali]
MSFAGCVNDALLGPAVKGCRGDFDFTLKFELIFLSLIPASVFLAVSLPRLIYLSRRPIIVKGSVFRTIKLLAIAAYAVLQLSLLGMAAAISAKLRDLFISSATLRVISSLCMLTLSFLEHARSPRPSILLNSYLFLTILLDIVQTRTLWLASTTKDEFAITRVNTAALVLKTAIAFLESQHKDRWIKLNLKAHSPEETTGIYGLGAYVWLNKLFLTGYSKVLRMDDLYPLDSSMTAEALEARLSSFMKNPKLRGQKFGLGRALGNTLAVALLTPVGPRIAFIGFTFCQPFLINSTLSYLEEPSTTRNLNIGYGLIGATIIIFTGMALSNALYWYFHERSMWMARGALASAIYRKTTEAKIGISDDSAAITLMSTDVEKIRQGMLMMHEFWANTIEAAIASFLLYRYLGIAFVAPILVIVVCVLLAAGVASFTSNRQKEWMDKIQARVGMTANVIANMKSLRISGLALPIESMVQNLRLEELRVGSRFRMVLTYSVVIAFAPFFISPVLTFAWTSTTLDVTTMFTSYSYLVLLCNPLTSLFQCIPQVLAASACLSRIQAFLESDPREDYRNSSETQHRSFEEKPLPDLADTNGHAKTNPVVSICKGSFGWTEGDPTLDNIDVTIPARQLTVVVGPIASGKTTFCKALLGESPYFDGQIALLPKSRRVGYCDQNPFLSNATIKQNIAGFSPFNQSRYNEVIEATMLTVDLLTLPEADDTKVGSDGITLSGGQKQRVSMARALYLETEFFIFDDILSGLDADTEEQVFRRVFGPDGLIKRRGATAVLCTHSIRHLPSADHIIALADGTIVEQGNFHELMANQKYVHSLGVKVKDSEQQSLASSGAAVEIEENIPDPLLRAKTTTEINAQEDDELVSRRNGDRKVYYHYYRSIGFWPVMAFTILALVCGFLYNFQNIWITLWSTGISRTPPAHSNAFYIGMFAALQVVALVCLFGVVYVLMKWMIGLSGSALHKAALHTVINAPLRFFTTTDTGAITNYFSQDMTLIDGELPLAVMNLTLNVAISIGMAAVIAISSPYLAISYPFLVLVLWTIQKFYLRTSRQLRLLDLEAKSPLYTHFLDTMKGLATFRAFGWISDGIVKNRDLLDNSQRPAYLLAMIQRWLTFVLDSAVSVLAIVVVVLSTQLPSNTGFTGASLITLMSFGSIITSLVLTYTQLEISLGAISRLKTFSEKVKPEQLPGEDIVPDESWPQKGEIEIRGVSASYSDAPIDSETSDSYIGITPCPPSPCNLALRDLNITIHGGEKVAICGRSGSGKSSTILLLLRLLDPIHSTVENIDIDGVPLYRIDRAILRQRIIAIPQDAVFLPEGSSFKLNLDPFVVSSDLECKSVLETVGLWAFVTERGGLAAGMSPETLSQGQRQLFSLARAILRRRIRSREVAKGQDRGILLLDEVSSSVDMDTERAMHDCIKSEFEGYTIVMVSHRLEMVMDFDRVIVMDRGALVEAGAPRVLVETEGSRFKELWTVSNMGRDS